MAASVIWVGGWAQLIGIPIAWIRLRHRPAWTERPKGLRRIELLAEFVVVPTAAAIVWGWLVLLVAAVGGLGVSTHSMALLMFGAPAIIVPLAVLQLDPDGVGRLRRRR